MTASKDEKKTPKPAPPVSELLPIKGPLGRIFGGLNTVLKLFRKG